MRFGSGVALAAALICAGGAAFATDLRARWIASYTWTDKADWFGGFSGISMAADGSAMTVIGDRGFLLRARVTRSDGQITGVEADPPQDLKAGGNRALTGRDKDAEGLAITRDGRVIISFEGTHRVGIYDPVGTRAQVLPDIAELSELHPNRSLEALALDRYGRIYVIAELPAVQDGTIPVYRWDGARWQVPFTLPRRGSFLVVGADFGPDGRLYVLERAVSVFGFRSRVRSWGMAQGLPRDGVTHLQTRAREHDNLEGLSVWRDGAGAIRLTMIADDNFNFFQRTEIVEYALPVPLAPDPVTR